VRIRKPKLPSIGILRPRRMDMTRFLGPFFGFLFFVTVLALLMSVAIATAQSGGRVPSARTATLVAASGGTETVNEHMTVSEDLTFSWPIVVMLCVSAAGYAGVVASVRQHHANNDAHLTIPVLDTHYMTQRVCELQHGETDRRLKSIESKLDVLLERK
jgi:1-aminocyclopropane-1-carboxylate deaminase/D-cysteine desulfhydrase-like pyridoxal-dependent ACC family enzyme